MAEIERNQLRRGRMSSGGQKTVKNEDKVGEVLDPMSVMNDSISQKRQQQDAVDVHASDKKKTTRARKSVQKTTQVDDLPETQGQDIILSDLEDVHSVDKDHTSASIRTEKSMKKQESTRAHTRAKQKHQDTSMSRADNKNTSSKRIDRAFVKDKPMKFDIRSKQEDSKCCICRCLWKKIVEFFGFGKKTSGHCGCKRNNSYRAGGHQQDKHGANRDDRRSTRHTHTRSK